MLSVKPTLGGVRPSAMQKIANGRSARRRNSIAVDTHRHSTWSAEQAC